MPIEIHTKTGRETEVWQILDAWKKTYPKKFRFFKAALQRMRQVRKNPDGSWVDRKGRRAQVKFQAPTELWLFLQYRIPGFGKTDDDVRLLLKVAGDFFAAGSMDHKRQFYSVKDQTKKKKKSEKKTDEDKRDNDRPKRGEFDPRLNRESPPVQLPS